MGDSHLSSGSTFCQIYKGAEITGRTNRGYDDSWHCKEYQLCSNKSSKSKCYSIVGKNKVQTLLTYGQYSLFKKWKILVEGDFTPLGKLHSLNRLNVEEKRGFGITDIRTIAMTRNWLLMCHMHRLYQVCGDEIVSAGISLELRRLVPLKFLKVLVSSPDRQIIEIQNQNGEAKEYKFIEKSGFQQTKDPFVTWRKVIGSLQPNHDEPTLYLTLKMFETWSKNHTCKITLETCGKEHTSTTRENFNQDIVTEEKAETVDLHSDSVSTEYIPGHEASVGFSESMTLSHKSDEVEGIEAAFGPSRQMSFDDSRQDFSSNSEASSSLTSDGKKRKRSVREVFRMGLFLSRKNKKRSSNPIQPSGAAPTTPEPDQNRPRLVQRRISRLEMNEPIEDIFNEVIFETMDKKISPTVATCDDNDVIEDPDVVAMTSMLHKQCSASDETKDSEIGRDSDFLTFQGESTFDASNENGDVSNDSDLT